MLDKLLKRLAHYSFNWKISLLTLCLLPLLLSLGFWQLTREQEKLQLQAVYQKRATAAPVSLSAIDWDSPDLLYVPVAVDGEFLNEWFFFLDNKIFQGRPGFEVIQALLTPEGTIVFINRGWVVQGNYRTDLPLVEALQGAQKLLGEIYIPLGEQVLLNENTQSQTWPRILQVADVAVMAEAIGAGSKVFPHIVRLDEGQPGALPRNWQPVSTRPEKHRAYAVQWFTMATVLLMMYVWVSTKPREEYDSKGSQEKSSG